MDYNSLLTRRKKMANRKEYYVAKVVSYTPYTTQILFKTFKRKEAYDYMGTVAVERPFHLEDGRTKDDEHVFIIYADAYHGIKR